MILISIMLALIIERLGAKSPPWQIITYINYYKGATLSFLPKPSSQYSDAGFIMWLLAPVLLCGYLYGVFNSLILQFSFSVVVLLVCFGCATKRALYKSYLNALTRGDSEAIETFAKQLGQRKANTDHEGEWFGQTLAWINFTHYCAVIFWFVVLGTPGAVLYAMVRALLEQAVDDDKSILHEKKSLLTRLLFCLNWLPARIASFGYLVIGNFSKGTDVWLKYALDFSTTNRKIVTATALAAEQIEMRYQGCTYEATCMMRLVKRNILFYLALIALLTLFGLLP